MNEKHKKILKKLAFEIPYFCGYVILFWAMSYFCKCDPCAPAIDIGNYTYNLTMNITDFVIQ